jgi:putative DNA primase/helicase
MTLLEWALTYARLGWPVFPCNPRTKQPLVKGDVDAKGKPIPRTGGLKKASTDTAIITQWWTRWPKAMIGLACGDQARVFVLDGDVGVDKDTGEEFTLERITGELAAALGATLPQTWCVATPRGGRHWYFQLPHAGFGNSRGALPQRFDVRGQGGYVVLPPSQRNDGKAYEWLEKPKAAGEFPAAAPAELIHCIALTGRWKGWQRPVDDTLELTDDARPPRRTPGARRSSALAAVPRPVSGPLQWADESVVRYAEAAFADDIAKLKASVEGTRNENLFHTSIRLAQLVAAHALDAPRARKALEEAAALWPNFAKSLTTIDSGWQRGLAEPRDLSAVREAAAERAARHAAARPPEPPPASLDDYGATLPKRQPSQAGSGGGEPPRQGGGGDGGPPDDGARQRALDPQCAFRPMTDLGNVERFVLRFAGRLLWCPAIGWLWWDGRRWNPDMAETRVLAAEHETVRAIQDEARWLANSEHDVVVEERKAPGRPKKGEADPLPIVIMMSDKLAQFGRASESKPRMRLADDAKAHLAVAAAALDADPFKINVLNGTVRIVRARRGPDIEFGPHDPADLITKLAPVNYDPDATCPEYDGFLAKVQPDPLMVRFLHQWGGYSHCGDASEQVFTFHWGKGKNGKSTLFNAWGYVAGDYGTSIRIETFLDQGKAASGGAPTPDLAMLKSVRYLRTSEPERGAKLAEALMKLATGGEPMNVRHLNREFFQLTPVFKLTMSGNYKPTIVGTDEGIWRRVRLVPWLVEIPKDERIKDFDRVRLKPEVSGIFNRLLAGLIDWLEHGLIEPKEVLQATEEYREDSDPLGRFMKACVASELKGRVQSSVLYALFCAWAKANGEREWTPTGFGRAMRERGIRSKHSDVNWWLGIRMIKTVDDFVDSDGVPRKAGQEAAENGNGAGQVDDTVPL